MRNPITAFQQRYFRRAMPSAWRALSDLESEMGRMLQRTNPWPEEYPEFDFAPSCDLKETNKEYVVQFDIPGVKKEEVKIEIEDNRLTISGERKANKEEKDAKHYLSESFYGSFMRTFSLPGSVDEGKVDAHYEDGVLTVRIPKTSATKARAIEIQ